MNLDFNKENLTRLFIFISLVLGLTGLIIGVTSIVKTNSNTQQGNDLQAQINNLLTQMNTNNEELQQQLNDQQILITKQQTQITSLIGQIKNIQSQPNSTSSIQQQISTFQSNLNQLQSSLASIKQSIPTTTLYDIVYQSTWQNLFNAPQSTAIICPDLMQLLTITMKSIVTLTLIGHLTFNSNLIFISFAVDGVPIAKEYSDNQYSNVKMFAYSFIGFDGYMPITLTQKIILNPSDQAYKIQLFAETEYSSGRINSLNGGGIQVEVQTIPPQIQ